MAVLGVVEVGLVERLELLGDGGLGCGLGSSGHGLLLSSGGSCSRLLGVLVMDGSLVVGSSNISLVVDGGLVMGGCLGMDSGLMVESRSLVVGNGLVRVVGGLMSGGLVGDSVMGLNMGLVFTLDHWLEVEITVLNITVEWLVGELVVLTSVAAVDLRVVVHLFMVASISVTAVDVSNSSVIVGVSDSP